MKKIFIILLSLVLAGSLFMLTGCNKDDREILYVYTESGFPPFEYSRGTDIVGVDMDIAQAIADELGMRLVIKDVMFDSIVAGISENNAIGAAGITITQKRAEAVDFSIPYYGDAVQYVIYRTNELTTDENLKVSGDQLKNKKLGVQTGTTGDIAATEQKATGGLFAGATVVQYDNAIQGIQVLTSSGSAIDYVIIDRLTALQLVANNSGLSCSEIDGMDAEEYAIIVKKGNTELLNVVNTVIARLKAEGKIAQFLENHSASIEE